MHVFSKMPVGSLRFSEKKIFRPKMPEICRKNRHFLEISSLVFSNFFAQRCLLAMLLTWPSPICDKIFLSGRKYRKYAGNRRFCRFSMDFLHIFRCSFSHKSFNDIVFTFVRSSVRSLACSFVHTLVRRALSYFH